MGLSKKLIGLAALIVAVWCLFLYRSPMERQLAKLQSQVARADSEREKVRSILHDRQTQATELRSDLVAQFRSFATSERDDVADALRDGSFQKKYSSRSNATKTLATFNKLCVVETSLKRLQEREAKLDEVVELGEGLIFQLQIIVDDGKVLDEGFVEEIDRFQADIDVLNGSVDPLEPSDVNDVQAINAALKEVVEKAGQR